MFLFSTDYFYVLCISYSYITKFTKDVLRSFQLLQNCFALKSTSKNTLFMSSYASFSLQLLFYYVQSWFCNVQLLLFASFSFQLPFGLQQQFWYVQHLATSMHYLPFSYCFAKFCFQLPFCCVWFATFSIRLWFCNFQLLVSKLLILLFSCHSAVFSRNFQLLFCCFSYSFTTFSFQLLFW